MSENNKVENPPAFPQMVSNYKSLVSGLIYDNRAAAGDCVEYHTRFTGLSMRDYFAAKAMQALVPLWNENGTEFEGQVSTSAYIIADAMLLERSRPHPLTKPTK